MTTDTAPQHKADKMPIAGLGTLSSSLIEALSPMNFEDRLNAPWIKALGGGDAYGPGMSTLIEALSPKTADAASTSWIKALGVDTYASKAFIDILGPKTADAAWTKAFGANAYGPGMSSLIEALSPKTADAASTSWIKALGVDTYGPGMSTLIDAVLPKTGGRLNAPWIKALGGGDAYGPGLSTLIDAVSPDSLAGELPPSLEHVYISELSAVDMQSVEAECPESVCDGSGLVEPEGEILQWPCDAQDVVAILIALSVVSVVLFFHLQELEWAVPTATVLSSLLISLVLRRRS